jgi:hypothetical protein
MSWTALIYVLVIFVIFIVTLLVWAWPRNRDGSFMSVEEADEFLKRFPPAPTGRVKRWVILVFATLGMIGVALTHHHHDDDHDHDHH